MYEGLDVDIGILVNFHQGRQMDDFSFTCMNFFAFNLADTPVSGTLHLLSFKSLDSIGLFSAVDPTLPCENGWVPITEEDGSVGCYYKSDNPHSFIDAYAECALKGGDLVSTQSNIQQINVLDT